MPFQKSIWVCDFCKRKKSVRKGIIETHERQCFKNPNRIPYLGELTFTSQEGKIVDFGYDESIQGTWYEWVEHPEMPPWWPGEAGMIWTGKEWLKVPGYSQDLPKPGHGCAGGAPVNDSWPRLDNIALPEVRARERLAILNA